MSPPPSDRLFIPPRIGGSTVADFIERKNRRAFSNIRQRRGGAVRVGRHIAVNVGGACKDNGKQWARGGAGVYFGPSSRYNFSKELGKHGRPQTNQRAEVNAATIALRKVKKLLDKEKLDTRLVLILSDSQYLVKGITQYIYKWQDNGWMSSRRRPVDNQEDFEELDELIDELEDDYEVFVRFWWIPKEDNEDADEMAREAAGFYDSDSDSDSD
ncbi:hypothetical protein NP233_g7992 [Leucocoprinus birnbaumii]|uniref:ribonuclease H n=1 Tax=Leucocoprinus birnbaumii TaxID=56174 RepID=A0AAD5VN38_9AGAR|nr:hypothetical protein NP233_g7992 [Leucocoprinus birnbaumii]